MPTLTHNLAVAKDCLLYIQKLNLRVLNSPIHKYKHPVSPVTLESCRRDIKAEIKKATNDDQKHFLASKIALRYKVVQCSELSSIGFTYLRKTKHIRDVDIVAIEHGNHMFLVIGLPEDSGPDYRSWPDSAVVLDPWAESIFPVHEIDIKLKDASPLNNAPRKFNPTAQSLFFALQNRHPQEKIAPHPRYPLRSRG